MAFNTSRRGAAVAGSAAGERNDALARFTPFALGGRLGSGEGGAESLGVDAGRSFQSLGLGAALGG
jgi:hypothetical protein